jgi:uncharacterized DUF497 family protein
MSKKPLRFTWDPKKAEANLAKHGVSFDEGSTAFLDPLASLFADEDHSFSEQRQIAVGYSTVGQLLLVSFVDIGDNTLRILSTRRATRRERKNHEENRRPENQR